MSGPPVRGIWRIVVQNFFNSFKSRHSSAELIGEDNLGNKYYESIPTKNSNRTRPSRYYLPAAGEEDFMQDLPAEWEAWLRGRRKVPPTIEEIAKNNEIAALKKVNARKLEAEREGIKLIDEPSKDPKGYESYPRYGEEFEFMPGNKPDKK